MSDKQLPIFRGSLSTVRNTCANCGTDWTGCWRRGWILDGNSVNLCNKCGLKYKNGKLESPLRETQPDVSQDASHTSPIVEASESSGAYVAYSVERQSDGPVAKKVLFYVHDADGNEKLALTGFDIRGTGHFTYESVEGIQPPLKCKNRRWVFSWLEDMGAVRLIERSEEAIPSQLSKKQIKTPQRPSLDKEYSEYRGETGKEAEVGSENFYLVDTDGHERLAICGGAHGDWYRCVIQNHDMTFDDREEAVGWLEWVVGKADCPPERFLKKEPRKPIRTRETYSSSLEESGTQKRRSVPSMMDDMQAIFEDPDLMRWVLRKPASAEIEIFHQWRQKLTVGCAGNEDLNNAHQDPQELLDLLRLIQQKETCLKLLEVSSLGRPISALRRHPNQEVAEIATDLTKTWNEWTTRALEKASAARKRNSLIS